MTTQDKKELVKKLVVFSILMENHSGIIDKSPSYILEKWELVNIGTNPEQLLDENNRVKFNKYMRIWFEK
ncbi:MAG: hypothetical protein QW474_03005 [Candidatus Aenigmatarchaeota archaeon]